MSVVPDRRSAMRRRALLVGLAASGLAPGVARAQPTRTIRIGIIGLRQASDLSGPEPRAPSTRAFIDGMRELGYIYGKDFVTEARGVDNSPRPLPALVAELIGSKVDVIVAAGTALSALKQATSTIPVVMAASENPVADGYVDSLAKPGRNFTGLAFGGVELYGKRLELLKKIVPGTAPIAVMWEGSSAGWQSAETAARAQRWKLLSIEVRTAADIDAAFRKAASANVAGLLVVASTALFVHAQEVVDLAASYRLPAMYGARRFFEGGGLMSYGVDINDIWRHAATYVSKIIKGAKAAQLPVEQPTKFALALNLKTAKALALTIPQDLLLRADEIVQ